MEGIISNGQLDIWKIGIHKCVNVQDRWERKQVTLRDSRYFLRWPVCWGPMTWKVESEDHLRVQLVLFPWQPLGAHGTMVEAEEWEAVVRLRAESVRWRPLRVPLVHFHFHFQDHWGFHKATFTILSSIAQLLRWKLSLTYNKVLHPIPSTISTRSRFWSQ